uniref:G-protein coupled receptors family 1 profile domain-containing protein n=1 Tax=Scylla olivacea TaxID=85551 RepID=A0A0P4WNQ4_SCYOL
MISFDRYNIICNGFNGPKMTNGKAIFLAIISWAISIGFAIAPLFGWGKYTLEGILDSCSYDYLTQDFNVSPPAPTARHLSSAIRDIIMITSLMSSRPHLMFLFPTTDQELQHCHLRRRLFPPGRYHHLLCVHREGHLRSRGRYARTGQEDERDNPPHRRKSSIFGTVRSIFL